MGKLITAVLFMILISAIGLAALWVYSIPLEWMWNKYLLQITGVKVTTPLVFGSLLILSMVHVSIFYKANTNQDKDLSDVVSETIVGIVAKTIALYIPWAILYAIA